MTSDAIVDRVRSICASPPFSFAEAADWDSFDLQPTTNIDGVFRVPPTSSQSVRGGFSYTEDRTDTLQVWVARKHGQDFDTARRTLLRDVHSLTSAIVRDAHQVSGEFGILDEGRGHAIRRDAGAEYLLVSLSLPVNYEFQL
jgi:hypothetical protein